METSTTGGIQGLKDDDGAGAARITSLGDSLSCLQLPSICGFTGRAMIGMRSNKNIELKNKKNLLHSLSHFVPLLLESLNSLFFLSFVDFCRKCIEQHDHGRLGDHFQVLPFLAGILSSFVDSPQS